MAEEQKYVDDKSKKLIEIGYSPYYVRRIKDHILAYTNFKTVKYNSINEYCLKVEAITTLIDGHKFKTIWAVDKDFSLRFVTLITREVKKHE